jgi:hypothetical protein
LVTHNKSNNSIGRNPGRNGTTNARLNSERRSKDVRNALNSKSVAGALRNKNSLHNPNARTRIVANAAMAGRFRNGWWRHRNGGYGWIGPLFWPFAYYDFYDYALWGYGYDDAFWGYGYDDIYAGVFSPYGYDDLAGYLPAGGGSVRRVTDGLGSQAPDRSMSQPSQLAQMCGDDSSDIAGLSIDRFRETLQPNEEQRVALDELTKASAKASGDIKAACPNVVALTAPSRIAVMQQRIEAMIAAVDTVQPPLEKFYGLLNDEQKARLTALGNSQREGRTAVRAGGSLAQNCGSTQAGVIDWPMADIDRAVRPTEAQRASLAELQNAAAKASEMLKACPLESPLTPPARLKAVGDRLETMLQAVKTVSTALGKFYGELNDEQKAQFEAIGPARTTQADSSEDRPRARRTHGRRHGAINPRRMLRRFGIIL